MALNIDGCHRFRVGRTLGLTLYAQWGDEADKADTYLGVFDSRAWAADVATALNGRLGGDRFLVAIGRLLYPIRRGPIAALDDFIGVATSPGVAQYISQVAIWYPPMTPPPLVASDG